MLSKQIDKLFRSYDNETLCIEAWGKNALRVRCTKNANFTGNDWALLPKEETECSVEICQYLNPQKGPTTLAEWGIFNKMLESGSITNGKLTVKVNEHGKIVFSRNDGTVLLQEQWRTKTSKQPKSSLERKGRKLKPINGDSFRVKCRFEPISDEKIFGMGQYQMPFFDKKGCTLELVHRNSQASVPFYISNAGYGMLWNNPANRNHSQLEPVLHQPHCDFFPSG